jgi:predicted  nucleic acid-binding Zn-ribbon protein
MPKRKPITSAESAVKTMLDAALGLPEVPAHIRLRDGDRPFWEGVMRARARDEWAEADLVVAAQLARCQADIESESRALDDEVAVSTDRHEMLVVNPRIGLIEQLCRRQMALMRSLRMAGRVAGAAEDEIPRRQAARAAAQVRQEVEDDGLLAR